VIEIDGSLYSGSGTLLRHAVALATLLGQPLHMTRIRAKREKPGLRPQHLQAVRACSRLSDGTAEGAEVGSQEIFYKPGKQLRYGDLEFHIGTAGSTTMLAFTLIPLALFAEGPSRLSLSGGLFQDFAPSAFHLQKVLLPILRKMGADVKVEMHRPGYVPKGQGKLGLEISPLKGPLKPLRMTEQGATRRIQGISLASHLENEQVGKRMADQCAKLLAPKGYRPQIDTIDDQTALQKGAALALWAETETGCIIGADRAGAPGRRSEEIARFAVSSLLEDLATQATTDRHLADQLILFAALAEGTTQYLIPRMSDHIQSNLWLADKILGVKSDVSGNLLTVHGIGFQKAG
jgi:RNA 3'-terminal phosphate cyclase (ATP)